MCPGEERTPIMGQNARTSVIVSLCVLALSLLLLLCFSVLPVAHSQTKPGPPSAPPVTVSVIEVSPKALPLYTEYTGTTDALETVEIRARVDGFIEQKLFNGGQVIKAGERLYLLDQRTFIAEVQKAKAAVAKAEADLRYAKEGVEVFRAESRLAQSRAGADQDGTGRGAVCATGQGTGRLATRPGRRCGPTRRGTGRSGGPQDGADADQTHPAHADRPGHCRTRSGTGQLTPGRAQSGLYRHPCPGDRPYRRVGRLCRQPGDEKLVQASDAAVPP